MNGYKNIKKLALHSLKLYRDFNDSKRDFSLYIDQGLFFLNQIENVLKQASKLMKPFWRGRRLRKKLINALIHTQTQLQELKDFDGV